MAVIFKRQTKLFPNIKDRIELATYVPPPPKPTIAETVLSSAVQKVASAKESFMEAIEWLQEKIEVMGPAGLPGDPNDPTQKPVLDEKKAEFYFGSMPRKIFNIFTKFGYASVATAATYTAGTIFIIFDGIKYVVNDAFNALVDSFNKVKGKGFIKSLVDIFSKKPDLLKMTPQEIFDSLPDAVRKDLLAKGYTRDSTEFAALARALSQGLRKCDEEDCIKNLESGNDRFHLKQKLQGILKKLDLNSEDEFAKFRKKVIDTLSDRFSLFAKFQQMVIDELYKIGIPQIPEITTDFFQILNGSVPSDDELKDSEHDTNLREMREIYTSENYAPTNKKKKESIEVELPF